jgi:hypothetical protein
MTQQRITAISTLTSLHVRTTGAATRAIRKVAVIAASLMTGLFVMNSASAQSGIEINTAFPGGKLTELSAMKTTLSVPAFADARQMDDPRVIFTGDPAENGTAMANRPFAEIVGEAMENAFAASDARLADEGAGMRLAGTLIATEAAVIDRGGVESLQLTLRTSIQLVEGTRIVWQTNLFGRGTVPVSQGTGAAVRKALDRLAEELLIDDYFLAEIR